MGLPPRVFYSYAPDALKDEGGRELLEKFETHVELLEHKEKIIIERTFAGSIPEQSIDQIMTSVDVILLLLTPAYLTKCNDQIQKALEAYSRNKVLIIPVILKPCGWSHTSLATFNPLPRDGIAVTLCSDFDQAFVNITEEVLQLAIQQKRRNDAAINQPAYNQKAPRGSRFSFSIFKMFLLIVVGLLLLGVVGYFVNSVFYLVNLHPNCLDAQEQGIWRGLQVNSVGTDCIGLSEGNALFDFNSSNKNFISDAQKAVESSLKDPLSSESQTDWGKVVNDDAPDAEPKIYQEDMNVWEDGHAYVTIVAAAILTGQYFHSGYDILQGVYLLQYENNQKCSLILKYKGCVLLNVIVANVGSGNSSDEATNAETVARFVRNAVTSDSKIVGVMSGLSNLSTKNFNNQLNDIKNQNTSQVNRLPIVAAIATGDTPSAIYLHQVAPLNRFEAQAAADYAKSQKNLSRIAILYRNDFYGQNLRAHFKEDFSEGEKYKIADTELYSPDNAGDIQKSLEKILSSSSKPDAIYCACYGNELNLLLKELQKQKGSQFSKLLILGGDTFYQLGDYTSDTAPEMYRLRFTSFTYPDIWENLHTEPPDEIKTAIKDYSKIYGAGVGDKSYGVTRMTPNVAVAYDAMLVFSTGVNNLIVIKGVTADKITGDQLDMAINSEDVVGISGRIHFLAGNDYPSNKIIVIVQAVITYDKYGHAGFTFRYGGYFKGNLQ